MKRAYVDANVILRLITGDPPDMADKASRLFEQVDRGQLELIVDPLIIAECVWVLSSSYGLKSSDIAPIMASFIAGDGIICHEKEDVLRSFALYEYKNVDFIDAFMAVRMMRDKVYEVYSFDTHFDRLGSIKRLEPE